MALGLKSRDDLTNFQSNESKNNYRSPDFEETEVAKSSFWIKKYITPLDDFEVEVGRQTGSP